MYDQREAIAQALSASFGGAYWISKGRARKHAAYLVNAGASMPPAVRSAEQMAALPDGAVVEQMGSGLPPRFFLKRSGMWHDIDGGEPVADPAVQASAAGTPAWFAIRRG
jgi:hypothetical protein